MDCTGTHVISEYLNIYHTTVVQTICMHIDLSEVVCILPLLHSLHAHFLVFGVHLAHDVQKFAFNI